MFKCKRCGYETGLKTNLKTHLKRKNICKVSEEGSDIDRTDLLKELDGSKEKDKVYECEYCKKKYSFMSGKSRHYQICKESFEKLGIEYTKALEHKLQEMSKVVYGNTTTTNNNNNNINIQINNNVPQLRPFGKENMTPLDIQTIGDLFLNLNIPELLKTLHCNPDYPENHNIRIKSVKRRAIEIFRGDKWDIVTYVKGLNEYLLQGHEIFTEYYHNHKDTIKDEMTAKEIEDVLEKLREIGDLNTHVVKDFHDDLALMLESIRTIEKNEISLL